MNKVLVTSIIISLLAAFQVYLGLNMQDFGVGGLHLHITIAIILLGLAHIPFIRGEGLVRKVFMGLILLITLQGLIGLYLAFIQSVRMLVVVHHIIGWIVLFTSIAGTGLSLRGFSTGFR